MIQIINTEVSLMSLLIAISIFLAILVPFTFFTVEQQSAYLIERFGKFVRIATPGLSRGKRTDRE